MSLGPLTKDHTLLRAAKFFGYNHTFVADKRKHNIESFTQDVDDMERFLQELGLTKGVWYIAGGDFAIQRQDYQVFFAISDPKIATLFKLRFS